MNGVAKQSEEEGLLDPRALSKPRDLQVDAASAWAFVDTLDNGVVVIAYDNGKVVECDNPNLTESESRHCKLAMEQNGDDANGQQGGQAWKYPTKSPTKPPTKSPTIPPTNRPTIFTTESLQPTDSPTPRGDPFVLRGIIWYDRNANGSRVIDDAGRTATGDEPSDAVVRVAGTTAAAANAAAFGSLRQPVLVAGAVGLGVGVTVLGLGLVPAFLANGSEADLTRLRVGYVDSGGDPAILDDAAVKQAEVDDRRALWNNVGLYAAWTGALVAIAGGAALAAAVTLIDDETEVQP